MKNLFLLLGILLFSSTSFAQLSSTGITNNTPSTYNFTFYDNDGANCGQIIQTNIVVGPYSTASHSTSSGYRIRYAEITEINTGCGKGMLFDLSFPYSDCNECSPTASPIYNYQTVRCGPSRGIFVTFEWHLDINNCASNITITP